MIGAWTMQGMRWYLDGWLFSLDGPFWAKIKILLGWAMQGMGWDQDGWLFSFSGAFLNEKKNNSRVGHARNGMKSGRVTLFVRWDFVERNEKSYQGGPCKGWDLISMDDSFLSLDWAFLSERNHNIKAGHARDGMRSGRVSLFVRRGLFERKEQ